MPHDASSWNHQRVVWASLNALRARPIDLDRVAHLRDASLDTLADPVELEALLLALGLNDEAVAELPPELRAHSGSGLLIWQYPAQFAKYLVQLSKLRVRSYLEIGIRHGGSFVATTEYLQRFHPLARAIGVDVIPCPSMAAYQARNPTAEFWCINTRSPDFVQRLDALGAPGDRAVDLVFIDSHHEEAQCREELHLVAERANMIAFHDISNIGCPGVGRVWRELCGAQSHACFEYTAQYGDLGPYMGIGLAVRKERLP